MKYFLGTVALVLALFNTVHVVQAAAICNPVDASNYAECCDPNIGGEEVAANDAQCAAYEKTLTTTTTTTTTNCSIVTAANVNSCCPGSSTEQQLDACRTYYYYNPPSTSQQVGGTAAPTGAAVSTGNVNQSTTSYGTTTTATTSDQQALAACSAIQFKNVLYIAIWAKCVIGAVVIPGIFTLAFVVFLWGVFKFIRASEQKDKDEGKQFIYMGLIGLFVMVSVWGIIRILGSTFGITTTVPTLQTDYLDQNKAK